MLGGQGDRFSAELRLRNKKHHSVGAAVSFRMVRKASNLCIRK